jgi:hypothetical protein
MVLKEIDYVQCIDGRKGTIVHVYTTPSEAYEIEFDGTKGSTETVLPKQIEKILWSNVAK